VDYLGENLKYLRKINGLTQDELASKLNIKRSAIGAYEEGRATPKISVLQQLTSTFTISLDDIINRPLKEVGMPKEKNDVDIHGNNIRVVTAVVNKENKEHITLVPEKASAGYTKGFGDPEFIEKLPIFEFPLPELSQERTYRVFQISGDSMEPIKSGSYIICEYVLDWDYIQEGKHYILITQTEGILFKRLYKKGDKIMLQSDNPEYEPYTIPIIELMEVWKVLGYISFELPDPKEAALNKLHNLMMDVKNDISNMKK
jgi:transcriptional regulator with XRE-family HTH domain